MQEIMILLPKKFNNMNKAKMMVLKTIKKDLQVGEKQSFNKQEPWHLRSGKWVYLISPEVICQIKS